ncbi:MAG TPA: CpaD family pilus assembly lipoprotein, partial [Stellaceae bacterium]
VTPPDCPNWSKPASGDHSNTLPSNFGCADATNLGLMVADPRDLVLGRSLGPPRGDPALYGYSRYRTGKPRKPDTTGTSGSFSFSGFGGADADTGY